MLLGPSILANESLSSFWLCSLSQKLFKWPKDWKVEKIQISLLASSLHPLFCETWSWFLCSSSTNWCPPFAQLAWDLGWSPYFQWYASFFIWLTWEKKRVLKNLCTSLVIISNSFLNFRENCRKMNSKFLGIFFDREKYFIWFSWFLWILFCMEN